MTKIQVLRHFGHETTAPPQNYLKQGRIQGEGARGAHPPPEMTCGFLIQLVFCPPKKLCGLLVLKQSKRRVHPLLKKILDPPLLSGSESVTVYIQSLTFEPKIKYLCAKWECIPPPPPLPAPSFARSISAFSVPKAVCPAFCWINRLIY